MQMEKNIELDLLALFNECAKEAKKGEQEDNVNHPKHYNTVNCNRQQKTSKSIIIRKYMAAYLSYRSGGRYTFCEQQSPLTLR